MTEPTVNLVPEFGIGEVAGPLAYLETALPEFCQRIDMTLGDQKRFVDAAMTSAHACVPLLDRDVLLAGMVNPISQARMFWNLTGDMLLDQSSTATGMEHLETAMHYQSKGYNVAIVQNHRSGSDMLVMETLIRRHFGTDVAAEWSYMAGHAVNLFLIPLMFSAAMRRFQIFAVKYQSSGVPGLDLTAMKEQNQRALSKLRQHTLPGGKVVVYYPEGGRGDGTMKLGEPRTSCLPRAIAENGRGLVILPTYVLGTETLHRPARGQNEFNEVLLHMNRGAASLHIGEPINWEAIVDANRCHEANRILWNQRVCNTLLTLIARLGPDDQAGPYNQHCAHNWSLIAPLVNGGAH